MKKQVIELNIESEETYYVLLKALTDHINLKDDEAVKSGAVLAAMTILVCDTLSPKDAKEAVKELHESFGEIALFYKLTGGRNAKNY